MKKKFAVALRVTNRWVICFHFSKSNEVMDSEMMDSPCHKKIKPRSALVNTTLFSKLTLIMLCTTGCGGGSGGESTAPPPPDQQVEKRENPVFESPLGIASDPAVIRVDSNTLHLYYTAENAQIGLVRSIDNGRTWKHPEGLTGEDFAVLQGQPDKWDQVLETVEVIKVGHEYWMYYTGYREGESDNPYVENYQVGLAISTDNGLSFVRHNTSTENPLISISKHDETAMDRHAITSPSVVLSNNQFHMVYTGWNTSDDFSRPSAGFWTMAAISADGIHWVKQPEPILSVEEVAPWTTGDINESDITLGSDGTWYFSFTGEEGIGIATATRFLGPYSGITEPFITKDHAWEKAEIVAPNLLIENGTLVSGQALRIWYTGIESDTFFPAVIGYAEAPLPL